jgi:glycosyltransferase 2 family protein
VTTSLKLRRPFILIGRITITVLIVNFVYQRLNWIQVFETLRKLNVLWFSLGVLLQGIGLSLAAVRWQRLLLYQGIPLTVQFSFRLLLIGQFFNLFYLGSMGGDIARFVGLSRRLQNRKTQVILSLIQDRLIGLGALLLLLTGLISGHRFILTESTISWLFLWGVPGACLAFFGGALILWRWKARPDNKSWIKRQLSGNHRFSILQDPLPQPIFGLTMVLSLGNHILVFSAGMMVAWAIGIDISFSVAGIILGVTALMLSLPITIAGLGVRDGVILWLMGLFGFSSTTAALGLSCCLLVINLWWALIGGLLFIYSNATRSAPDDIGG